MQGIKNKLFLCIFLFVILIPIPNKVSAQSEFQTFEENPIEYWELNNIIATYNQNNTITIKQDDPYDTSVWFDTSFLYRKIVNISGSSGAGNNYQINFTVLYDSNMQTDFDDIRFTDNDKVTKLNYFRESYTASVSAKFWVRVTDSLDSDNYIYMYFGNSLASSESSGLNTFDFYDDFNDGSLNASKWGENIGSTGTPSESGGKLNYVGVASQWGSYCSFEEFTYNHAVRMKVYVSLESNYYWVGLDERSSDGTSSGGVDQATIGYDGSKYYVTGRQGTQTKSARTTVYTTERDLEIQWFDSKVDFFESSLLAKSISTNIPLDNMGIILLGQNARTFTWDFVYIRKCIDNEPYYFALGDYDNVTSYKGKSSIDIPLIKSDSVTIKTMIELVTKNNNETLTFQLNTSLGIDTHLTFKVNETYDRTRIEITLKHAINVYRITAYNENQNFIARNQTSFINSKDVKYLRLEFSNFEVSSRALLFYLTGSVDYSSYSSWEKTETTKDPFVDVANQFQLKLTTSNTAGFDVVNVSYFKRFSAFQFLRTYLSINVNEDGTTYFLSTFPLNSSITIHIENITIIFYIQYQYDDDAINPSWFKSYVKIYDESTLIYNPQLSFSGGTGFLSSGYERVCKIVAWRTQEDNLGVAYNSGVDLFEPLYGIEPEEDKMNVFVYDKEIDDFSGNITISHYLRISTNNDFSFSLVLDQCEYMFNSNFGIAQPTFSSTWFSIFGAFPMFDWLWQWGSGLWSQITAGFESAKVNVVDEFFDWVTGIGEAVADFLQPAFDSIVNAFSGIGDTLTGFIGSWGETAFNAIVDILGSVASAIADFLLWFIDGIGSLLGITGLAGIIASLIATFVSTITSFISGIILMLSLFVDGIAWVFVTITTYLPMAIMLLTLFFLLSITGALLTFDDKIILDVISFWGGILIKFLEICYAGANMIVQFIGGIIP